ncbi:MAG: hypothetical protein ACFFCL_01350 [Promethearchaeota archaeon]
MRLKISTFQKINLIAISAGIITFFIPTFIDIRDQTIIYYVLEFKHPSNLPIFSLLIVGLVAAILSTIMSFKGMLDMCMEYLAGILITIASIIFILYISQSLFYGFFLGYAPFAALISGILIIINASTEVKNFSRDELILPRGIVLPGIWNPVIRSLMPFQIFWLDYFSYNIYFFLLFFIIRGILDVILVFGARIVLIKLKIGGYVCLISIILVIFIELWLIIIIPKNLFFGLWLLLLGIPFLYQIHGSIKIFRETREL